VATKSEDFVILACVVLIQYGNAIDRQTDASATTKMSLA